MFPPKSPIPALGQLTGNTDIYGVEALILSSYTLLNVDFLNTSRWSWTNPLIQDPAAVVAPCRDGHSMGGFLYLWQRVSSWKVLFFMELFSWEVHLEMVEVPGCHARIDA